MQVVECNHATKVEGTEGADVYSSNAKSVSESDLSAWSIPTAKSQDAWSIDSECKLKIINVDEEDDNYNRLMMIFNPSKGKNSTPVKKEYKEEYCQDRIIIDDDSDESDSDESSNSSMPTLVERDNESDSSERESDSDEEENNSEESTVIDKDDNESFKSG